MTPVVLVLTGTDHHPFDRLVDWVDASAQGRPDVRFVIQHGLSRRPTVADGHRFLGHHQLLTLMGVASVVVCHGGPGLISEAREAGHLPVCVPRDPALGEHVDGHQQRFATVAHRDGFVRTVWSQDSFEHELDASLAAGPRRVAEGIAEGIAEAAARGTRGPGTRAAARALLAAELDGLLAVRPFRIARLHRSVAS